MRRSKAAGWAPSFAGFGSKTKRPGPRGPEGRRSVRVALADDQLVFRVAVEVGAPDGVAPLDGLGDRPCGPRGRRRWRGCRRRPDDRARARSWRCRADPSARRADLHLAGPLERSRLLVARAELSLGPRAVLAPVQPEDALPAGQHDLVAAIAVEVDELEVVDRVQRSSAISTGQWSFDGIGRHVVDQDPDPLPFAPVGRLRAAALQGGDDELLPAGSLDVAPPQAVERRLVEPDRDGPARSPRRSRPQPLEGAWPGGVGRAPARAQREVDPAVAVDVVGLDADVVLLGDAPDDVVPLPSRGSDTRRPHPRSRPRHRASRRRRRPPP